MQDLHENTTNGPNEHSNFWILADITRFHARQTPDHTALFFAGHQTTYRQLDGYANQVANGV